jgi:hypothetical protein
MVKIRVTDSVEEIYITKKGCADEVSSIGLDLYLLFIAVTLYTIKKLKK